MRSLLPAPFVATLLLGACDGGTPAAAPTPSAAATGGGYVAKVQALAPKQRAGVMLRAIRDADRPCQGVVAEKAVGSGATGTAWLATCDDQGHWLVTIADDGSATVANAQDMAGQR